MNKTNSQRLFFFYSFKNIRKFLTILIVFQPLYRIQKQSNFYDKYKLLSLLQKIKVQILRRRILITDNEQQFLLLFQYPVLSSGILQVQRELWHLSQNEMCYYYYRVPKFSHTFLYIVGYSPLLCPIE